MNIQSFIDRAAPTGILGVMVTQHGKLRAKHLWDEECRDSEPLMQAIFEEIYEKL